MMMLTALTSSCRFPLPSDWPPPAPATLHLQHRSCAGVVPGPSGNPVLLRRSHRSLRLLRPAVQSSQSQAAVVVNKETGDTMVAEAAAGADVPACVWGDFFVTYTPPPSQRSEEWMRERADELKGQVRRMFVTGKDMSIADMLNLVDTLERLGIDNHFHEEIDMALSRIHSEEQDYFDGSSDLHVVALRFCILRQASGYQQAYMELDRGILPAAQVVVNMARMNEMLYLHGRDAFTYGDTLKETVASLLLKDVSF